MANDDSNIIVLNEYISLPIIISNWDATNSNSDTATKSCNAELRRQCSTETFNTAKSTASSEQWKTGFADYVDSLWSQMTATVKPQLREACVEVLRRTDGASDEKMFAQFDDDARLLD